MDARESSRQFRRTSVSQARADRLLQPQFGLGEFERAARAHELRLAIGRESRARDEGGHLALRQGPDRGGETAALSQCIPANPSRDPESVGGKKAEYSGDGRRPGNWFTGFSTKVGVSRMAS